MLINPALMESKIQTLFQSLKESVFNGSGETAPELRQILRKKIKAEVESGSSEPCSQPALNEYSEKIARNSYKIVDQDIEKLKEAGFSEEEIYELTIATAWAAGVARFERGLDLLNSVSA